MATTGPRTMTTEHGGGHRGEEEEKKKRGERGLDMKLFRPQKADIGQVGKTDRRTGAQADRAGAGESGMVGSSDRGGATRRGRGGVPFCRRYR